MIEDNSQSNDQIRAWLNRLAEEVHPWERDHAERVTLYSLATAEKLGWNADQMANLRTAAALHDVGKLSCPEGPWKHPQNAMPEGSSDEVRGHASAGAELLRQAGYSLAIADIVEKHHERLDGSGYPHRLKAEEIPTEARIIGLAEFFDGIAFGPWSKKGADEARNWVISAWPGLWGEDVVAAFLEAERLIQPVENR